MHTSDVFDLVAALGLSMLVLMLVRPGSPGPDLVASWGHAFERVAAATINPAEGGNAPSLAGAGAKAGSSAATPQAFGIPAAPGGGTPAAPGDPFPSLPHAAPGQFV